MQAHPSCRTPGLRSQQCRPRLPVRVFAVTLLGWDRVLLEMSERVQDATLLRAFVRDGSQKTIAALVQRYAGLVFHATRRSSDSADLAFGEE